MITLFGIIWLLLCLYFLIFLSIEHLAGLVILSTFFQASAIFVIGGKGITPFFITEILFILKSIGMLKNIKINNTLFFLLIFLIYSIVISFVSPIILFKNKVNVFTIDTGIDFNYIYGGKPLMFSFRVISHIFYLIINFIVIFIFYLLRDKIKYDTLFKYFLFSISMVVFLGIWEFISKNTKIIPFPFDFIHSNPGYAQLHLSSMKGIFRLTSTYTEASFAGGVLASSFWAIFSLKNKKFYLLLFFIVLSLLFNLSGTGLGIFVAGFFVYMLFNNFNKIMIGSIVAIIIIVIILIPIYYFTEYGGIIRYMVETKFKKNHSGDIRLGTMLYSLRLLLQTYGIGVGLGSHRGSSLFFDIFALTGVVGGVCWTFLNINLLKPLFKEYEENIQAFSILIFAIIFTISQFLALPDLSLPNMWMWMFIAVVFKSNNNQS